MLHLEGLKGFSPTRLGYTEETVTTEVAYWFFTRRIVTKHDVVQKAFDKKPIGEMLRKHKSWVLDATGIFPLQSIASSPKGKDIKQAEAFPFSLNDNLPQYTEANLKQTTLITTGDGSRFLLPTECIKVEINPRRGVEMEIAIFVGSQFDMFMLKWVNVFFPSVEAKARLWPQAANR